MWTASEAWCWPWGCTVDREGEVGELGGEGDLEALLEAGADLVILLQGVSLVRRSEPRSNRCDPPTTEASSLSDCTASSSVSVPSFSSRPGVLRGDEGALRDEPSFPESTLEGDEGSEVDCLEGPFLALLRLLATASWTLACERRIHAFQMTNFFILSVPSLYLTSPFTALAVPLAGPVPSLLLRTASSCALSTEGGGGCGAGSSKGVMGIGAVVEGGEWKLESSGEVREVPTVELRFPFAVDDDPVLTVVALVLLLPLDEEPLFSSEPEPEPDVPSAESLPLLLPPSLLLGEDTEALLLVVLSCESGRVDLEGREALMRRLRMSSAAVGRLSQFL